MNGYILLDSEGYYFINLLLNGCKSNHRKIIPCMKFRNGFREKIKKEIENDGLPTTI